MAHRLSGVTRKELYELVWGVAPMALCGELVVSAELLFAICLDLVIPWPSDEYWRRRQAGLPTIRLRLPSIAELAQHLQPWPGDVVQRLDEMSPKTLRSSDGPIYERPLRCIAFMNTIAVAARAKGIRPTMPPYGAMHFSEWAVQLECIVRERSEHRRRKLVFRVADVGKDRVEPKEWVFERIADRGTVSEIVDVIEGVLKERRDRVDVAIEEARVKTLASIQQRHLAEYWNALVKAVDHRNERRRVELFLNEMESRIVDRSQLVGERSIEEWLLWARKEIARLDESDSDDVASFWKEIQASIWRRR